VQIVPCNFACDTRGDCFALLFRACEANGGGQGANCGQEQNAEARSREVFHSVILRRDTRVELQSHMTIEHQVLKDRKAKS